jgi:hypothetical protein
MSTKYSRTPHVSFSPGATSDDKRLASNDHFLGKEIVITSKVDGSNVCLTNEHCFARSHNSAPKHPSFDLFKQIHSQIKHSIPENLFIYAEYAFARHSIAYTQLPSYLLIFNILDTQTDTWLSWDDVDLVVASLQLTTVPVLWRGVLGSERALQSKIEALAGQKEFGVDEREGVVVRLAASFPKSEFGVSMGKWVRQGHVQTDEHWMHQAITRNRLKG